MNDFRNNGKTDQNFRWEFHIGEAFYSTQIATQQNHLPVNDDHLLSIKYINKNDGFFVQQILSSLFVCWFTNIVFTLAAMATEWVNNKIQNFFVRKKGDQHMLRIANGKFAKSVWWLGESDGFHNRNPQFMLWQYWEIIFVSRVCDDRFLYNPN